MIKLLAGNLYCIGMSWVWVRTTARQIYWSILVIQRKKIGVQVFTTIIIKLLSRDKLLVTTIFKNAKILTHRTTQMFL